jgi:hypothetical protein
METRRSLLPGLLGLAGLGVIAKADDDQNGEALGLLFAIRNTVINFSLATGVGNDLGTVQGLISGTLLQNFQFIPTSANTIKFDYPALFTDLDGDQIVFEVVGTGSFIVPLSDPANPLLGNLMSVGGPFVATFTVIRASGKYKFLMNTKFPAKLVASNTTNISNGVFGAVYGEVYSDKIDLIANQLKGSDR